MKFGSSGNFYNCTTTRGFCFLHRHAYNSNNYCKKYCHSYAGLKGRGSKKETWTRLPKSTLTAYIKIQIRVCAGRKKFFKKRKLPAACVDGAIFPSPVVFISSPL